MRHADAGYDDRDRVRARAGAGPAVPRRSHGRRCPAETMAQRAARHLRRVDARHRDGAILTRGGRIEWIGPEAERHHGLPAEVHDLGGAWVTRASSTATHTWCLPVHVPRICAASARPSTRRSPARGVESSPRCARYARLSSSWWMRAPALQALLAEGVTTIEIKSGYGLTLADEGKMLRVARALARPTPSPSEQHSSPRIRYRRNTPVVRTSISTPSSRIGCRTSRRRAGRRRGCFL